MASVQTQLAVTTALVMWDTLEMELIAPVSMSNMARKQSDPYFVVTVSISFYRYKRMQRENAQLSYQCHLHGYSWELPVQMFAGVHW